MKYLLCLLLILQINHARADYLKDFKHLEGDAMKSINSGELDKVIPYYKSTPKEQSYKESELKNKANAFRNSSKLRSQDPSLSEDEKLEAQALDIVKASEKRKFRYDKLDEEVWLNTSNEIASNPMPYVESECKIAGNVNSGQDIKLVPKTKMVKTQVRHESEETCEEDNSDFIKCSSTLKLSCASKVNEVAGINSPEKFGHLAYPHNHWWNSEQRVTGEGYIAPFLLFRLVSDTKDSPINREITFLVSNSSLMEEFRIVSTSSSSWTFNIYLNDHLVKSSKSSKPLSCSSADHRAQKENINLKPYLKEGNNVLKIEVKKEHFRASTTGRDNHCGAYDSGDVGVALKIANGTKVVCTNWQESWEESCAN